MRRGSEGAVMGDVAWIPAGAPPDAFPPVSHALARPDGLLAVGGDLAPARLLYAYRHGIFPWYSEGQPILWWSPSRRAVLWPHELKISRSLAKRLRQREFTVRCDSAFDAVVTGCATPRRDAPETWITGEMRLAYGVLHRRGYARSVETWREGELAGGLYGVALGGVFFGESMFSRRTDASKVALVHLCRLGFELIDCQLPNDHLARMGATLMPRERFVEHLDRWCELPPPAAKDAMH